MSMRKGEFHIPGLILALVLFIVYICLYPFFSAMVNIALAAGLDPGTATILTLLFPAAIVGLLNAYWNSVQAKTQVKK